MWRARTVIAVVLSILLVVAVSACASARRPPVISFQRFLDADLGDLAAAQLPSALDAELHLRPPLSAGVAWLKEEPPGSSRTAHPAPTSGHLRTGVLDAALDALRRDPFAVVVPLPIVPLLGDAPVQRPAIDALRSVSARFQHDVALLLKTRTSEDKGFNPFAVGYLGLITIPLFPGTNLGIASSAELCAIDVRSGIMLGCARGRGSAAKRYLFPLQVKSRRTQLVEATLRSSVIAAAGDLLPLLSLRVAE